MSVEESIARRSKTHNKILPFLKAGGAAALAGLAFAHFTYNDEPACSGTQEVAVNPGDTISSIKYAAIDTPDNKHTDLRDVDYSVMRYTDGTLQSVGQTSDIMPNDIVTLAQTCK